MTICGSPKSPLGCVKLRRGGILKRRDGCQNGLARFVRSNLCLVHVTPKTEDSSKVPDLDIVFADKSVPAMAVRAGAKRTKYGVMEFFPFVLESFGVCGKDALKLLDLVSLEGLSLGFSTRMTKLQFRR
jgi:hypothetical protein